MSQSVNEHVAQRLVETFDAATVVTRTWDEDERGRGTLAVPGSDLADRRRHTVTRRWAPAAAAAAVLAVVGSAVVISAHRHTGSASTPAAGHGSSVSLPPPVTTPSLTNLSAAPPAAGTVLEPAWVQNCMQGAGAPVAAYIGLSLSAARALALQRGETLIGYGVDGACQGQLGVKVANPVAIAVTGANSEESNPDQATVVYAAVAGATGGS